MGKYEDEDGIDGPWNRAMDKAMREDAMKYRNDHQDEREPESGEEELFVENAIAALVRAARDVLPYGNDRKKAVLMWLLDEYDPKPKTPANEIEDPDIKF